MVGRIALTILLPAISSLAAADALPVTPAETLTGKKVQFPTALEGKAAVCVFGFSKEAGDRTKEWMTQLNHDGINAWSVANLEKAPAFVRGMIRSSMRKGTPPSQADHFLIMTKDEKDWAHILALKQDKQPVVAVLDADGKILWTYEGSFSEQPYLELKSRYGAASTK
jgi:hypothetical protein